MSLLRLLLALPIFVISNCVLAQQHSIGVGLFTGFTVPYTMDAGIDNDPRYDANYKLKAAPIGLAFSKDYEGYGFVITPGIFTIGQNYQVVNTEGGHNGQREINLRYFSVPIAFKLHLIDLDFFRVSAIASISGAYLYDAEDILHHESAKLKFPIQTHASLPEGYTIQYDGVLVPDVKNYQVASYDDFEKIQLFGGVGLRSDWDVSNHWRVSIDFRVNYGILDSRNALYLDRIQNYQSIYETPGRRRELFAQLGFGISRFIDFDKNDKDRAKKLKGGGTRMYVPQKQSKPKSKSRR